MTTRQTERDRLVYDVIWTTENDRAPSETFVEMMRRLNSELDRPPRIADLGCGSGRHALHAARGGARATAVDHSSRAVERIRNASNGLDCGVVAADAFTWIERQPTASLDGIVCFDAIHHMSDDEAAVGKCLSTMRSALAPRGYLLVTFLCDIRYSHGSVPPGRLLLGVDQARDLLRRSFSDVELIREKQKDVHVDSTVNIDADTGEMRESTYDARRLLWLCQAKG